MEGRIVKPAVVGKEDPAESLAICLEQMRLVHVGLGLAPGESHGSFSETVAYVVDDLRGQLNGAMDTIATKEMKIEQLLEVVDRIADLKKREDGLLYGDEDYGYIIEKAKNLTR